MVRMMGRCTSLLALTPRQLVLGSASAAASGEARATVAMKARKRMVRRLFIVALRCGWSRMIDLALGSDAEEAYKKEDEKAGRNRLLKLPIMYCHVDLVSSCSVNKEFVCG